MKKTQSYREAFMGDTVLDIFDFHVTSHPKKTAVTFERKSLTYRQLNEKSNQLAHFLLRLGISPGTPVPILLSDPLEGLITILGILKAGGAYVPIDTTFPAERISYLLEDTGASVAVSSSDDTQTLPATNHLKHTILVDRQAPDICLESQENLPDCPSRHHLAYIIYTSGSTGQPKGVLMEHGPLASYIKKQGEFLNIGSNERILQFSNYCFDASVEQIFLALCHGVTLVLLPKNARQDMALFSSFINEQRITHLHATPSFLEQVPVKAYSNLIRIVSAGEPCKKHIIANWLAHVDFINKYGPTETCISTHEHRCTVDDLAASGNVPIGEPLPGIHQYILSPDGDLVSGNDIGELFIGGDQLARGYLNLPEQTNERFLLNHPGIAERIYRTGDLVRQLPGGKIEYIGRIDEQVKVRGYRVELREIEHTLQQAPGVSQCTVAAQDDSLGNKQLVGYVITKGGFNKSAIFVHLRSKLPSYMVPAILVPVDQFPLTHTGKINKKELPIPNAANLSTQSFILPRKKLEKILADLWTSILPASRIGINDNFFELGGNSLLAQKMVTLLGQQHGMHLAVTTLYQYPVLGQLAKFFDEGRSAIADRTGRGIEPTDFDDIAVIGMSCRFPGAHSIKAYWDVLKNGKETTRFFLDDELAPSIPLSLRTHPDYVKARGVLDQVGDFDAAFFGITPALAKLMDPQQRIFLEIAWEALEHSGCVPQKYNGTIGVYAGCRYNTYYVNNVLPNKELIEKAGNFQVTTINDKDYIATRTAYSLNLKGPAVTVQSACSTSLLAVAQAVQAIRSGQCDVALAGGASISPPIISGHLYEEGAILSKDGHCRPFDTAATGTVFSDGAGVVVLKSRKQAEADGDTIYAVIKGIGVSNDGAGKGSFTAPNVAGQAAAIRMALSDADVLPEQLSYIEAHGTATPLGDPIEIEGLKMVFGPQQKKQFCAIGSVKSNMGHTTNAAGIAGFIKTVLSIHHQQLPPSINFEQANHYIDFENSPFFVNTALQPWTGNSLLAGVSSFGVGGTNVHVVVGNATSPLPPQEAQSANLPLMRPMHLISWSAKHVNSITQYAQKLHQSIERSANSNVADIAYTLHIARQDFSNRVFMVVADTNELKNALGNAELLATSNKAVETPIRDVVFMFPGQGAQFTQMGLDLYLHEPIFQQAVDRCAEIFMNETGEDIRGVIYPERSSPEATERLRDTLYSQPALFTIGYALAQTWMHWGLRPSALIGHSVGEFVAAHLSGIFSLEDAIKLIASRAKLMGSLPTGTMLSVRHPASDLVSLLPGDLDIAAVNSPQLCVVSGPENAIQSFSDLLNDKNIANKRLHTSHAFHSSMMDSVVEPFGETVAAIALREPEIPICSTVTGNWLRADEAKNPLYWAGHLRATVHFSEAAAVLLKEYDAFVEMGPGNTLTTLVKQQCPKERSPLVLPSLVQRESAQSAYQTMLNTLGSLWQHGFAPDWQSFYGQGKKQRFTDLPTYAYNRQHYWVDGNNPSTPNQTEQLLQTDIPVPAISYHHPTVMPNNMRKDTLIETLRTVLEDTSGIEMSNVSVDMGFMEIGLDSLLLTQIALVLKREFSVPVTFRQLNEDFFTLDRLATYLDQQLPAETPQPATVQATTVAQSPVAAVQEPVFSNVSVGSAIGNANTVAINLISQQLHLLSQQLMLLQGQSHLTQPAVSPIQPVSPVQNEQRITPSQQAAVKPQPSIAPPVDEAPEAAKPFGAGARIEKQAAALTAKQLEFVNQLTARYNAKTVKSKSYTQEHRAYMADPRVVSGFKPTTKELVYSVVVNQSNGSRLWDIDGNEYIDALNGFGSNMLGYQPDFIKQALIAQIEKGYEIGPQHELSGEVCKLICEFTKFDRAALCNTGSEAVLGAMRIARTVTGKPKVVAFSGSYHGITDEVIVRSNKKLKTFPAAPGIMAENVQNMIILDYNVDESLDIIRDRSDEVAAVLVEPIQSRHSELRPLEFLKKLRKLTEELGIVLIFDEVISGFRFHPGGIQGMYGIQADLGTYGKVAGGGISIGIIAGKKQYMDALDGGFWQYGDNSIPEVGVTYFAGTFVRHPLALATAKASLQYLKEQGPQLQKTLNRKTEYLAHKLNNTCKHLRVPLYIAQFGSQWRIKFKEEYPYSELFFTLMRLKGIHILEGFSCFLTTAHSDQDIETIIEKFEESLIELKAVDLIPDYQHPESTDEITDPFAVPPLPNAKLGKDKSGNPAWFVMDEKNPGNYLQLN
ncbi:polyketide synthase [Parapedobacter sp. 10938]|uniref:polyketide synthase n=1 Tax=Parapedobacter flavus TaxID=3110225 RepID=UPI002DBE1C56|nr:polyketide synthase [Parapedobacter sp. 10938]MEC3879881.1 amino acid adenylation domain-containing protein [Parapedobacter sp. 10938]